MRSWLIAAMLAAIQLAPQEQTGTIEGLVAGSGAMPAPISGALVSIIQQTMDFRGITRFTSETTSDGSGHFSFGNVPSGGYTVEVKAEGYGSRPTPLTWNETSRTLITLAAGQRVTIPTVALIRLATLRGHVVDKDNKPVAMANVELLRPTADEDGRKIWASVTSVVTDQLGEYRSVLPAGEYYLRAIVKSGQTNRVVYYPETLTGNSAAPVVVSDGSEVIADIRTGIAFSKTVHQISGSVVPPEVFSTEAGFVELILLEHDTYGPGERSLRSLSAAELVLMKRPKESPDGQSNYRFTLNQIPAGRYDLIANANVNGADYSARTTLNLLDADLERIDLKLRRSVEVKGRVIVDGASNIRLWGRDVDNGFLSTPTRPQPDDIKLTLVRKDGMPVGTQGPGAPVLDQDGRSFAFTDVPQGDYDLSVSIESNHRPPGDEHYIADIRARGRSVFDTGFEVGVDAVDSLEVLIESNGAAIEGKIEGSTSPLPAAVILVPDTIHQGNAALYRVVYVPQVGEFKIHGIAPGSYRIFAVPHLNEPIPYRSPEFIARHESRATTVTIQKGTTLSGVKAPYLSLGR